MTRMGNLIATGVLVGSALMAVQTGSASAVTVPNFYECNPRSGWCYQVNPPYNPSVPRSCQWNDHVYVTSGMWYTGCTQGYWRPYQH